MGIGNNNNGEQVERLNNLLEVVKYLKGLGWKVSKSAVYRHRSEGKIRPQADGSFSASDVEKYARNFLQQKDGTAVRSNRGAGVDLIEARRRKIQVETEIKEYELREKHGDFMEVAEHQQIMCAKYLLIRDTTLNWVREHALDLIRSCGGDQARAYDVIDTYQQSIQKYWNRLGTGKEWPILPAEDWTEPILK